MLPSVIDRRKAITSFTTLRDNLSHLIQGNITDVANQLYSKSIISQEALAEALNQNHTALFRTVALLNVVENRIRAQPHAFSEFVEILGSDSSLDVVVSDLIASYTSAVATPGITSVPPCISRYADYLKDVYSRSCVSSDGKFPPTPSEKFIKLALIPKDKTPRDLEELMQYTLHGKVDELLQNDKQEIDISGIICPNEDGSQLTLGFIEGPPGIGKSTLARELCRRREQFSLAVLLRLRERKVQQVKEIPDLFHHVNENLQQSVTKEVKSTDGNGVLFILDGFDELPVQLRSDCLLIDLIWGVSLPKSTVIVTSRPSASSDFFRSCRPQVQRHVEILGFTQRSVSDYAASIFGAGSDILRDFLAYISASNNPAINSLMYIPLNAAIVVEVYRNSRRTGLPIPRTLTQLYTQLCLALVQRFLDEISLNTSIMSKFTDIPESLQPHFSRLAQLAFEKFKKQEVIFYAADIPGDFVHFGLLDTAPALLGGGGVSFNFLHLTLQEFLAAYYISKLPNGIDVYRQFHDDGQWNLVWRFVSGLTCFAYFMDEIMKKILIKDCSAENSHFFSSNWVIAKHFYDRTVLSLPLIQCMYEAQTKFTLFKGLVRTCLLPSHSSLDGFALGYCIANSSSDVVWDLQLLYYSYGESLMWGLNSKKNCDGIISRLRVTGDCTNFKYCPSSILQKLSHLGIHLNNASPSSIEHARSLAEAIPSMSVLYSFELVSDRSIYPTIKIIEKLSYINTLRLINFRPDFELLESQRFYECLTMLIRPNGGKLKRLHVDILWGQHNNRYVYSYGKLKRLHVDIFWEQQNNKCVFSLSKQLCDVVFSPSSLTSFRLLLENTLVPPSMALLVRNTNLTEVDVPQIQGNKLCSTLIEIVRENTTLKQLRIGVFHGRKAFLSLEAVVDALAFNATLEELCLYVVSYCELHTTEEAFSISTKRCYPFLCSDSRIRICPGTRIGSLINQLFGTCDINVVKDNCPRLVVSLLAHNPV